jgi:hypothetical protein
MSASPRLRKFVLITHVTTSVGWIGAVAAYLVLAIIVMVDKDPLMLRSILLVMKPLTWYILIPLAFASLVVGIIQSLVTPWGLLRHYWVLYKLLLTIIAVAILIQYTLELGPYVATAANPASSRDAIMKLSDPGHLLHAAGGMIVLLVIMVLSMYKPRGTTKYGDRKRLEQLRSSYGRKQRTPSFPS